MSDTYNKAESSNPEKRSKEFTSPTNEGGAPLGRTKAPKGGEAPKSPLADFEAKSKETNHQNG